MNKSKITRFLNSSWILLFPIAFYISGMFFMPKENIEYLKRIGYASQEEYTWTDREGEEHEDVTLISIDGIGKVLTYDNIYLSLIVLSVPSLVIGRLLFGEYVNEIKCLIFCNSLIGITLLALSTREHIMSNILYWLGIVSACFCTKLGERYNKKLYDMTDKIFK